jgi:NitT/TauT family transport system substrate-binding protein
LHTWAGITPFYFADDNDYFQKNKLKVKLVGLEKDEDRIKAFKNGEIDLLHLTADSLYYLKNIEKIDCEIAMFLDSSLGGDALVVNSDISDIRQLVGKKIGVEKGLFSHFFLAYLLDKNGLKMEDIEIIFLNGSDIGTSFLNKNIDAAVLWEPWLSSVLRITKTKVLISTEQEKDTIISVLFARKGFIEKNKDKLKAIQDIWDKIIFDFKKDKPNFLMKLSPYLGLSRDDFMLQISKLEFIWKENRDEYRGKVKNAILEGNKFWKSQKVKK